MIGLLAACLTLAGCETPMCRINSLKPGYRPDNVFLYTSGLSFELKRVAVLPMAHDAQQMDLADGCEALGPILQSELIKTKRFEIISVSPESLRNRTGRPAWTGAEVLPPDFFDSLHEMYGCDAVLFCQLTVFRAYTPVAVGWRMKLVDVRTRQTLWAVDELFDAGQKAVRNGAGNFEVDKQQTSDDTRNDWLVQNSPRRFGQYAAAQILETLPKR